MPISLYDAVIPSQRQIIAAVSALLDKAAALGMAEADLIAAKLAPDMLPLGYQVKAVAEHAQAAIEGVRAGVYSPSLDPWPDTIAGLKAKLAEADAFLAALDPEEIESFVGRDMAFAFGETRMPFAAEHFLLSFSQPNFYFHAATAYDILRAQGLAIGKRDFMGMPRIRQ